MHKKTNLNFKTRGRTLSIVVICLILPKLDKNMQIVYFFENGCYCSVIATKYSLFFVILWILHYLVEVQERFLGGLCLGALCQPKSLASVFQKR